MFKEFARTLVEWLYCTEIINMGFKFRQILFEAPDPSVGICMTLDMFTNSSKLQHTYL